MSKWQETVGETGMRLRRVAEHLRAQNWTAVALDFVIVVVGVFVAMEVADWNAERIDRRSERAVIARLSEDFDGIVAFETEALARVEAAAKASEDFSKRMAEGTMPDDPAALRALFDPMRTVRGPAPSAATYEQLVTNGEMRLLRSERLQAALTSFERERRVHEKSHEMISASSLDLSRDFWVSVGLAEANSAAANPAYAAALRENVASPGFAAAVSSLRTQHNNSLKRHRLTLIEAQKVAALLDDLD